ncbi:MAG: hypothetical protein US50_C0044G0008 [Candidatus Nomurabacteria bacterium GW2011_GWB1_37_5]|uniref:Methionine aminopeptidase n=1 Tax=Candidatus Nomurabacteria bacterium GW2011_GWB1_37_5 TaxID=1618742 RepID=A0A0G0H7M6_9BACT|nr:MAG: hypothetical protein US50_C0044G0008 [Candidatus Nomurabacteria bacterium GW2011_GWB1_37_5]
MIIIKTKEEIEIMREGGRRLAAILQNVKEKIKPGVSTKELDDYTRELIKDGEQPASAQGSGEAKDEPAFLNYKPAGVKRPYPAALCVSVNEEVVHGIPSPDRILKEGDIVSIDCGLKHNGLFTDHAITVPVGEISKEAKKLIAVTEEALYIGIKAARVGGRIGDIGEAIEKFVAPHGYGIVRVLSGHGVGKKIHEDPYVPNYGEKGTGPKIVEGMTIAIEPMLTLGTDDVMLHSDEYTYSTTDKSLSAHFEHSIAITERGPQILTKN